MRPALRPLRIEFIAKRVAHRAASPQLNLCKHVQRYTELDLDKPKRCDLN